MFSLNRPSSFRKWFIFSKGLGWFFFKDKIMKIKKTFFKCTGCGIDRECYIETNQESNIFDDMVLEDLKCILDETNQTSYNWQELATKRKN